MAIKILNDLLPIAEQTEVGVVKPDNVSITITETGELQSSVVDLPEDVVTAENYDNPKLWKGTLEEYNAIETKNPLVTYIITDDNVETLKTTDYNALSNKPSVNDVTLEGNKTLEDLNIQAADTSLTTSQITNCITAIPQDIKLELTDGILTLKAGSKVYDGAGNPINITSDIKQSAAVAQAFIGFVYNGNSFIWETLDRCFSGDTYTGSISGNVVWYDTANKIVKRSTDGGSSWLSGTVSLPFVIITGNGTNVASIDQVFNGFGYIGSTRFTLGSGVKVLAPNGRNPDGSLNSIEYTLGFNIFSYSNPNTGTFATTEGNGRNHYRPYYEQSEKPSTSGIWYNPDDNYMRLSTDEGATWKIINEALIDFVTAENGRITSFNPKTTFNAIDRNDTEWASTASKPSSRYVDLTLGASGSTYIAPANGWFSLWQKDSTTSAGKITIRNLFSRFGSGSENTTTGFTNLNLPVHKNEQVAIYYINITATDFQFRFYFDEGVR